LKNEWFASQKKPKGNISKWLRERVYTAKPHGKELTKEDQKKQQNLNGILYAMMLGENA